MKLIIKKYWQLFKAFFKASFTADLEYRVNFLVRVTTDIFWYVAQISLFEVLFLQTDRLGGWTVEQSRVFLGILFFIDSIYMIIFSDNLDHFSEKIRKGDLDLLLSKPVNSQFIMSVQRISTPYITNLILSVFYLAWALYHYQLEDIYRLLWLLILLPCGLISTYSWRFIIASSSLYLVRAENLQYLWYQIYKLGTRPDTIYPKLVRYMILSVLPVAFMASVPSRFLFEPPSISLFFWVILISGLSLYLSNLIWTLGLKNYSSASS